MAMSVKAEPTKRALEFAGEGEVEGPRKKKAKLQSRKKKPGFDEEIFSETTYYVKNGLRYVKPYYFTFTTHAKGRWVGSKVYDVFCREFQAETPEYYEKAIKAGKVTVNGKLATMETVINHNDLVCHRIHRHEPPVTAEPLRIIHQDESFVVLNKPASIPVHPCGRYRHNSVVFLLGKEHNLRNLHTVHRLDRLTSGLLMFARSVGSAQRMEEQIRGRRVTKVYLCRVYGEFPSDPIECSKPILVVSHKLGVCRVDPEGKPCTTLFTRLSFNGKTSLVRCNPKTGRMHQIRVHLQWLGHPIVNDPLYNHPAWGPQRAKHGRGVTEMTKVITEIVKTNYNSESSFSPILGDKDSVSASTGTCFNFSEPTPAQVVTVCEASAVSKMVIQCSESLGEEQVSSRTEHSGTAEEPSHRTADYPNQQSLRYDMEDSGRLSVEAETVLPSSEAVIVKPACVETTTIKPSSVNTVVGLRPQQFDGTCAGVREQKSADSQKPESQEKLTAVKKCDQENFSILARTNATSEESSCITSALTAESSAVEVAGTSTERENETISAENSKCQVAAEGSLLVQRTTESGSGHTSEFPWQPPGVMAETDPDCTECALVRADPTPQELVMYLHALSYKGEDWEYTTEQPEWASLDWQD